MTLWCATTNAGKLREFQLLGADVEALPAMRRIPPSPEDGVTFEQNAAQKAIYYSAFTDGLLFADDSGLEVDALHGEPGVYSARYAGEHAGDAANNALLLERLEHVTDRRARFVCVIALTQKGSLIHTFRGTVEGQILRSPQGLGGFGYDPLFFYPPFNQTLAEVPDTNKFEVSHRGHALREMLAWLANTAYACQDSPPA
jgi:XTP/dITP diphosphohydrolase